MKNQSWWRMNPVSYHTYTIEWTPECGGVVRAKLDDIANWQYKECRCARFAESLGLEIIGQQRRMREMKDDFGHDEPFYSGA